jgi:hypothetical protein
MPLRINLLAEAQHLEDLRRRDPVKRAIWLGGFLICLVFVWSLFVQIRVMNATSEMENQKSLWNSLEPRYLAVSEELKQIGEIDAKLGALNRLSTNRFLWASVLNALQETTMESIRLSRIKAEQSYLITAPVPPQKTEGGRTTPGQPGHNTERIILTLEARDYGNPSQQNYDKFRQLLSKYPFFQERLQRQDGFVFAGTVGILTPDAQAPGESFVPFALEGRFPEVRRSE